MPASSDIALIDLEMPGMGGLEMIRQLRNDPRHYDLPVVVVTGRDDMSSIDLAYEAGATSFVTKPVNWRGRLRNFNQLRQPRFCCPRDQT